MSEQSLENQTHSSSLACDFATNAVSDNLSNSNTERRKGTSPMLTAIIMVILLITLTGGGFGAAQWLAQGLITASPECDEPELTVKDSSLEPPEHASSIQTRTLQVDTQELWFSKTNERGPTSQPALQESINTNYMNISTLKLDEMLQEEKILDEILLTQERVKSNLRKVNNHYVNEIRMLEMKLEKLGSSAQSK